MHKLTAMLLASTAVVAAAPAVLAQERAVPCEREVAAFVETVRQDQAFPRVEAIFDDVEADLVRAMEGDEASCFALLADVQTVLYEEGVDIEGATDVESIARIRARAEEPATTANFAMREDDRVSPERVAEPDERTVTAADEDETDLTEASQLPNVTVRQSEPDVTVREAPEADVEMVEDIDPETEASVPSAPGGEGAVETMEVRVLEYEPAGEAAGEARTERRQNLASMPEARDATPDDPFDDPRRGVRAEMRQSDDAPSLRGEVGDLAGMPEEEVDVGAVGDLAGPPERDAAVRTEVETEVESATVAEIEALAIREVEFPFDSATIPLEEVADVLGEVADLVAEEPDSSVLLTGYASPIGDFDYNMDLSEARVEAVEDALVDLGVPTRLIRTRSLGERNTEVRASETERSPANRRVEIRILERSGRAG